MVASRFECILLVTRVKGKGPSSMAEAKSGQYYKHNTSITQFLTHPLLCGMWSCFLNAPWAPARGCARHGRRPAAVLFVLHHKIPYHILSRISRGTGRYMSQGVFFCFVVFSEQVWAFCAHVFCVMLIDVPFIKPFFHETAGGVKEKRHDKPAHVHPDHLFFSFPSFLVLVSC